MESSTRPFAVVTGASSGIGLELAKIFVKEGHDVFVCAEDDGIISACNELRLSGGSTVDYLQVDLAKPEGVEELYSKIQGRPIDAIAINAGVGVGGDFAHQTDLNKELNLIDLNVRSTVHLAKLVSKDMAKNGKGRILFTSSIAADMPGSFEAVYGASKAFVQSFSQAIREELKDSGVSVTAMQPGPTETNFFHRAEMDDTRVGQMEKDDAAQVAQEGYEALMEGKDYVVTGSLINKVMSTVGKFLPEKTVSAIHRKLSEPGTGQH